MNNNLMHKIGCDQNENLSERNFVKYFEETLPTDETAFDKTVKQFLDCAISLRKKKIEKRAVAREAAPSVVDDVPKSPGSPRQVGAGLLRLFTSLALCVEFLPAQRTDIYCLSLAVKPCLPNLTFSPCLRYQQTQRCGLFLSPCLSLAIVVGND